MPITSPRIAFYHPRLSRWFGHASGWRSRIATVITIGVSATALSFELYRLDRLRSESIQVRERIAKVDLAHPQLSREPLRSVTPEEISVHNEIARQLNIPWSGLFDALERHADPEVAVLSAEPDAAGRRIRLIAEAKDAVTLLRFARSLSQDQAFGVLQLRLQETNDQDPNRPIRLSFDLRWSAASSVLDEAS